MYIIITHYKRMHIMVRVKIIITNIIDLNTCKIKNIFTFSVKFKNYLCSMLQFQQHQILS